MVSLTRPEREILNILAGGRMYLSADRRRYSRRFAPTIAASRVDRLARAGLVAVSTFVANGATVTAARLTEDGEGARR